MLLMSFKICLLVMILDLIFVAVLTSDTAAFAEGSFGLHPCGEEIRQFRASATCYTARPFPFKRVEAARMVTLFTESHFVYFIRFVFTADSVGCDGTSQIIARNWTVGIEPTMPIIPILSQPDANFECS